MSAFTRHQEGEEQPPFFGLSRIPKLVSKVADASKAAIASPLNMFVRVNAYFAAIVFCHSNQIKRKDLS